MFDRCSVCVLLLAGLLLGSFSTSLAQQQTNSRQRERTAARTNPRAPIRPPGVPRPEAPTVRRPQAPSFLPLTPREELYVNQLVDYWAKTSSQVQRFRCEFTRWEYDPVFGAGVDAQTGLMQAKTISSGKIRFSSPNKGMFKVERVRNYRPAKKSGEKPTYVDQDQESFEHWVCNGKSIFQLHAPTRQLMEIRLPPNMVGKGLADGPLPFLFSADASKIKERYWLHVITPQEAANKGEYWLEAFPRRQDDAAEYKMLHVIFDKVFYPQALKIFPPNYDPVRNPASTTLVLTKREWKWTDPLNLHERSFAAPSLPKGWTRSPPLLYGQPTDTPRNVSGQPRRRVGNARSAGASRENVSRRNVNRR